MTPRARRMWGRHLKLLKNKRNGWLSRGEWGSELWWLNGRIESIKILLGKKVK